MTGEFQFLDRLRLLTSGKCVGGERPFLCFDFDGDSCFEVYVEMILKDRDLHDQALVCVLDD